MDLASRIGSRSSAEVPDATSEPAPSAAEMPGPIGVERPEIIGSDEPPAPELTLPTAEEEEPKSAPILSVRGAPSLGEVDLVVTPLPTPDDWHRFELALRKVRGITQLRPEYYRHGVAKMRVTWEGNDRLATVLRAGVPGYRVRVIGEDRATLQILVSSGTDERRPG